MSNEGTKARERFHERMRQVAPGAKLSRRQIWIVETLKKLETSVELTLRSGRRTVLARVPVCHSGPILWEVGLRSMALPPSQRELWS